MALEMASRGTIGDVCFAATSNRRDGRRLRAPHLRLGAARRAPRGLRGEPRFERFELPRERPRR